MTATERLRKLLDERGIEWSSEIKGLPFFGSFFGVTFVGDWYFCEYATGELSATCRPVLTPEQAIAATLGSMSATVDDVLSLLDEMNEQGRIEYADYSQLHDAIAATLPTVGNNTRYHELFGTPERAARTLYYDKEPICAGCALMDECKKIPDEEHDTCLLVDYDALLEWMRGDA